MAASIAARVLGVARRDEGDLAAAADAFAESLRRAGAAGDEALAGRARISLVGLHIVAGDLTAARAEAARAAPILTPVDRARLDMQLGVAEERAGSLAEAVARYDGAGPVLVAAGDALWSARLRLNRSVAVAQLGRLAEAARDLDDGAVFFEHADNPVAATIALNRAWLAGLAGDVPEAMRRYDEAAAVADRVGLGAGLVERDRAELLGQVGLWDDAVVAADRAVADLARTNPLDAPEARLVLAAALTGARRFDDARAAATEAEREFLDQVRAAWAARAVVARVSAGLRTAPGGLDAASVADALAAVETLAAAGFDSDAVEARASAVRAAVVLGVPVPDVALPLVPVSGPPWTRARVWQAEAERRLAAGDGSGASRAVAAGLEAVSPLRRALGSLELRAGLGATVEALADLGVRLASARGPRSLLEWAERRAGGVGVRPAPAGPELSAALAALRAASAESAGADEGPRAAVMAGRVRAAEAEVRRLDRHARSIGDGPTRAGRRVVDLVGTRTLLRYVVVGEDLWRVVVSAGRARGRRLGTVGDVSALIDRLRFALRRFAGGGPGASRAAGAVRAAADALGALLVPSAIPEGAPVVVVPDGVLHGVPWGALDALASRVVVVAPSVGAWAAAAQRVEPGRPSAALFVGGPGLPGADAEIAAAAQAWGVGARVLPSTESHAGAVLDGMAGVRLAHVACHGSFRGDNPLFSSLLLADGPLTVHDILALDHVPEIVVLGACDVGESVAVAGAEVLGLAAGCLTAGASSVIASVLPLPDGAAAPVLADLVGRIARGTAPATALAESTAGTRDSADPTAYAVATSLCCFGSG